MAHASTHHAMIERLRLGLRRRIEFIAQNEASECGLACLAMIARHHGHDTDLQALRRRFPNSLVGSSLQRLMEIAESLSLAARPLRLELEELPQLRTPCILHWDLNHFVVLEACDGKRARLLDPAHGRRTLPLHEVSKHFTGVALELVRKPQFRKLSERRKLPWRSLIGHVTGLKRALLQVLMLSVTLEVFVLV
ncbi:MAG: peptidase domain-containing ABC transporter, partial [Dokdonella sp.]|nr:peptidase domain-containing ABC transporter [Dokdonella sp.]